jgi:hypothetical protein
MRTSTAILATAALGALVAVGSTTESMARGFHGGGGGGFHGTPFIRHGGGFGGREFARNGGFGMRHGFNRGYGFYGGRRFGRFHDRGDDFLAFGLGSLWGAGQYYAYNDYGGYPGGYCERYIGRHGIVHYYCP